jgi:hypothetical protein
MFVLIASLISAIHSPAKVGGFIRFCKQLTL